ncbi:hypothetical protein Ocin01_04545 [Orchesella cincta]|uniref:Uncharacterized protein n=1 Tax=Orchesella cincta TaxID=48709 RepID=A0A1D2NA49_ORCCI|nr:hypothetical protein Ocin01_04545 [Orchesella cincta]
MGNQRQVLKDKLEKELVLKIQEAKDVLGKLNKNLEINKQNSLSAHEDIRIAVDLIKGILMQREKEMLKEVEFLHSDQERSLKEAIKSTYMTLGSLQSTLTHLDSFDQGQLVKLQIPDIDWACAENEPSKISASVDCEDLTEELKEWGSVNADGFQYCMDIQDEGEFQFLRSQHTTTCAETDKTLTNTDVRVPEILTDSQPTKEGPNPLSSEWWNNNVQEWLSSKNVGKDATEEDEFIVVPSLHSDEDVEFYYPLDNKPGKGSCSNRTSFSASADDSSSIMCISKENGFPKDDLSVWLKPRKTSNMNKTTISIKDQNTPCCGTELPSIENFRAKRKSSSPTTNQFLDTWKASQTPAASNISGAEVLSIENFLASPQRKAASDKENCRYMTFPCLRMDSDLWIRKKKPKTSSSTSSMTSDRGLGLIPPSFDLPNPFWLRKYR